MGWKDFLGPLADIGGAILGIEGAKKSNKTNARIAREQMAMQKEFAQQGVRWKVADAQAAGLHPLAALGMSGMQYSPVQYQDSVGPAMAEAGQALSRAANRFSTSAERRMQDIALATAEKGLLESDARIDALRSEAMRNRMEALSVAPAPVNWPEPDLRGLFGPDVEKVVPETVRPSGGVKVSAPTVMHHTAGDQSTAAGITPMWRTFQLRPDMQVALPGGMAGDPSEALESLSESPLLMALVIEENVNRYGREWLTKFNRLSGRDGEPMWRRPGAAVGRWAADFVDDLKERSRNRTRAERAQFE